MTRESRTVAGIVLIVIPTVMIGGAALLVHLARSLPGYADNPLRQDLWRAGHAHAGVFLVLSLVLLRYVDEAALSAGWKWFVRLAAPVAAVLLPAAFFLSVVLPDARRPNGVLWLAPLGAGVLAVGVVALGIGLIRSSRSRSPQLENGPGDS